MGKEVNKARVICDNGSATIARVWEDIPGRVNRKIVVHYPLNEDIKFLEQNTVQPDFLVTSNRNSFEALRLIKLIKIGHQFSQRVLPPTMNIHQNIDFNKPSNLFSFAFQMLFKAPLFLLLAGLASAVNFKIYVSLRCPSNPRFHGTVSLIEKDMFMNDELTKITFNSGTIAKNGIQLLNLEASIDSDEYMSNTLETLVEITHNCHPNNEIYINSVDLPDCKFDDAECKSIVDADLTKMEFKTLNLSL